MFDVVYDPWPSHLIDVAEEADLPHVTGLDLLAHQAALQVELMTGGLGSIHSCCATLRWVSSALASLPSVTIALAAFAAAVLGAAGPWVLRRLPEPEDPADDKIPYARARRCARAVRRSRGRRGR